MSSAPTYELRVPLFRFGQDSPDFTPESKPIKGYDGTLIGHHSLSVPFNIKVDARPEVAKGLLTSIQKLGLRKMLDGLVQAANIFQNNELDSGGLLLNPEEFCKLQSIAMGSPISICRESMQKVSAALLRTEATLRGYLHSWIGEGISLEEIFEGKDNPRFARHSAILGAIMPSNTMAVYQLLAPGLALGPMLIKTGSGDCLTALRLREAYKQAGLPAEAVAVYHGDGESLAPAINNVCQNTMIFGDSDTVSAYHGNRNFEVHGPGCSKIIIGQDMAANWRDYLDSVIIPSVLNGSGRGCISCSAIYAPGSIAQEVAEAVDAKLREVNFLPLENDNAKLAVFGSANAAKGKLDLMDKFVKHGNGQFIGETGNRVEVHGNYSVLLPTVAYLSKVPEPGEYSASKFEIPAPAVLVVNMDNAPLAEVIGNTLVLTVLSNNAAFIDDLATDARISRLNRTPIPTTQIHTPGQPITPLEGDGIRWMYEKPMKKESY